MWFIHSILQYGEKDSLKHVKWSMSEMLWKDVSSILLIKRKDLMGFWLKKKKKYVWNILTKIFERSKHLCTKNIYVDCIGLTSPMSSILGLQISGKRHIHTNQSQLWFWTISVLLTFKISSIGHCMGHLDGRSYSIFIYKNIGWKLRNRFHCFTPSLDSGPRSSVSYPLEFY